MSDHAAVSVPPVGSPSSLAAPASVAIEGSSTDASGPALTTGAALATASGLTTMVTSSLLLNCPSDAVSRSTYVPAALKVTVVAGFETSANVTPAGPSMSDQ